MGWFRRLMRRLRFRTIHDVALMMGRERTGHEASPSAAKAAGHPCPRLNANKNIIRRNSRSAGADGRPTSDREPNHGADIANSAGAQAIPDAIHKRWPWIRHLFADGAYDRTRLLDKAAFLDSSSKLSPHRQRTTLQSASLRVGWLIRSRLIRDFEQRLDFSEAMIHVASEASCCAAWPTSGRSQTDANSRSQLTTSRLPGPGLTSLHQAARSSENKLSARQLTNSSP
jgi:putative transposase